MNWSLPIENNTSYFSRCTSQYPPPPVLGRSRDDVDAPLFQTMPQEEERHCRQALSASCNFSISTNPGNIPNHSTAIFNRIIRGRILDTPLNFSEEDCLRTPYRWLRPTQEAPTRTWAASSLMGLGGRGLLSYTDDPTVRSPACIKLGTVIQRQMYTEMCMHTNKERSRYTNIGLETKQTRWYTRAD